MEEKKVIFLFPNQNKYFLGSRRTDSRGNHRIHERNK